jgi:hypothetical protein
MSVAAARAAVSWPPVRREADGGEAKAGARVAPFARPRGERLRATEVAPTAVGFQLSDGVAADFRVEVAEPGRLPRCVSVRVEFPDDARALLETLSWSPGGRIVAVLEHVGVVAIHGAVAAGSFEAAGVVVIRVTSVALRSSLERAGPVGMSHG